MISVMKRTFNCSFHVRYWFNRLSMYKRLLMLKSVGTCTEPSIGAGIHTEKYLKQV